MKAAIFDPYLDTLGGGEVYTCSVIELLLKKGYTVDILWNDEKIKNKIKLYLDIDIEKAQINSKGYQIYKSTGNYLEKLRFSRSYDVYFYLSDGSIPWLFAKNNILHFQVPFQNVDGKSFANKLKLKFIHHIVCNSQFTKRFIDKEYGVNSKVVYPPINITKVNKRKENIILSVGRFTDTLHNKRQDVLIEAFIKLYQSGFKDWKLILVGSSKEGSKILKNLEKIIKGYPIEIKTDISHQELEEEYARAKIFWHAAGYGVDENLHPKLVEHFGIATAEAMAAGCVPVVLKKGGQKEIVLNKLHGFLWEEIKGLKKITERLINNEDILNNISKEAHRRSGNFSKSIFFKTFFEYYSI